MPNADSYTQRPLTELDDLEQQVADVLAQSVIKQMNWDPGFISRRTHGPTPAPNSSPPAWTHWRR